MLPTQMFPRFPARATIVADTNFVSGTQSVSDFVQKHFVSATNVSQFAQRKKHHGKQWALSIVPNRPVRDQWEYLRKMERHFPIK